MRYSLLSRFQGGLLGSIIGETLVSNYPGQDEKLSNWSKIGISATESLIGSGKIDRTDWQQICHRQKVFEDFKNTANSTEVALATLPVAIFFHESPSLLREQLQHLREIWQHSAEASEDVLIWWYAIALALREKLHASQFITQILDHLEQRSTSLVQQLEQVQTFLAQGTPLEQVVPQLSRQGKPSQTAIALAFYCFGYTPEDFRLCVTRAAQGGCQPQITAALTGALAGVYNSFCGIPVCWRLASQEHRLYRDSYQRAKRLFAVWSGVCEPGISHLPESAAVASPGVIQPRTSLKIISQGDMNSEPICVR
ncbi:MAG: ADP-ribosylglycohydrolase family protein [Xenococcaceae cyanobacterium]